MDSISSPNIIRHDEHLVLFAAAVKIAVARGALGGDEKQQAEAIAIGYSAALRAFELTRPVNPKPD
jgi:hypothetical protein